ncbi:hypothetical protein NQP46_31770 [Streptomyces albus]|nr:hypothetical protein NQP46_31770 [Streptomyces albus]
MTTERGLTFAGTPAVVHQVTPGRGDHLALGVHDNGAAQVRIDLGVPAALCAPRPPAPISTASSTSPWPSPTPIPPLPRGGSALLVPHGRPPRRGRGPRPDRPRSPACSPPWPPPARTPSPWWRGATG